MKIRTDFVTNSSSSSFIGVFAKVADKEKAKETLWELGLESYVKTGEQILKDMAHEYFVGYGAYWANAYIEVEKDDIDPKAEYLVWESYDGADPDSYTMTDGEWIEEDYSGVKLEDFDKWEQDVHNRIRKDTGFDEIQRAFGAGFDG